jgi:TPR repeat protein
MIGVIYENGCGNVAKNAMMARQNFKKAAQMGSEEAKARL